MEIIKANIRREEKYGGLFVECFVDVTYEDNSNETIFSYFPDELHFNSNQFINLTKDEAKRLCTKKDIAYLRS